jgi:hypothetical protein
VGAAPPAELKKLVPPRIGLRRPADDTAGRFARDKRKSLTPLSLWRGASRWHRAHRRRRSVPVQANLDLIYPFERCATGFVAAKLATGYRWQHVDPVLTEVADGASSLQGLIVLLAAGQGDLDGTDKI